MAFEPCGRVRTQMDGTVPSPRRYFKKHSTEFIFFSAHAQEASDEAAIKRARALMKRQSGGADGEAGADEDGSGSGSGSEAASDDGEPRDAEDGTAAPHSPEASSSGAGASAWSRNPDPCHVYGREELIKLFAHMNRALAPTQACLRT